MIKNCEAKRNLGEKTADSDGYNYVDKTNLISQLHRLFISLPNPVMVQFGTLILFFLIFIG